MARIFSYAHRSQFCSICKQPFYTARIPICPLCIQQLQLTYAWEYPSMRFYNGHPILQHTHSIFPLCYYRGESPIRRIVHLFKYTNRPLLAYQLGQVLGYYLQQAPYTPTFDAIVPIPLHAKRERARGYNQSFLIAKGLEEALHIPICTLLRRTHHTKPQALCHNESQRQHNVAQAFTLTTKVHTLPHAPHLLLVDDVITTGSTMAGAFYPLLDIPQVTISLGALAIASHLSSAPVISTSPSLPLLCNGYTGQM